MNIQWYPGHMTKAKRAIEKDVKLVDVVIILLDARAPISSQSMEMGHLSHKKLIFALNKIDLADKSITKLWEEEFKAQNKNSALLKADQGKGINRITALAEQVMAEKLANNKRRGRIFTPIRAMVAGVPNVGKSTFINSFVKKAVTKTADRPGVTRSNQWIKINKSFELLDTPGMLTPKFESQDIGLNLAFIGSIGYNLDNYSLVIHLIKKLQKIYPKALQKRYGIEFNENAEPLLEAVAKKRGLFIKGGELDLNRCANMVLEDFRSKKLGEISLEKPGDL